MNSNDRELLSLISRLILVIIICLVLVMLAECSRSHAAVVPAELVPGHRTIVIIQGEKSLAYTELVNRQIIGEKEVKTDKKAKHTDAELLAEVMYHENWHTDKDHLAAYYTGAVVMNRVNSPDWPDTVKDVLYQRGQYSTTGEFFTKEIPAECLLMAKQILKDGTPDVPVKIIYQSTFRQGSKVWKIIEGEYFCYE